MSTFLGLLLNQKKKEENRSIHNREIWYLSIILIIFILKFDFQVPHNNNIIFTQNVLFFSENVIFYEFSIKRYVLFILAFYNFFYKWVPKHKITLNFTFIDDY